jgi:hypothetical protein
MAEGLHKVTLLHIHSSIYSRLSSIASQRAAATAQSDDEPDGDFGSCSRLASWAGRCPGPWLHPPWPRPDRQASLGCPRFGERSQTVNNGPRLAREGRGHGRPEIARWGPAVAATSQCRAGGTGSVPPGRCSPAERRKEGRSRAQPSRATWCAARARGRDRTDWLVRMWSARGRPSRPRARRCAPTGPR